MNHLLWERYPSIYLSGDPSAMKQTRTLPARTLPARALTLPALGLALALTLTACGEPSEETIPAGPTEDTTPTAVADDDAADGTTEDSDDGTPEDSDDGTTATPSGLTVTVEGQGVKLLRVQGDDDVDDTDDVDDADDVDDTDDQVLKGKLISGPGGCLALQPGDQPQLLVFGEDAELSDSPPTVTMDDTAYQVGDDFPVEATRIDLADVQGVPDQCSQRAAAQAWLVDG